MDEQSQTQQERGSQSIVSQSNEPNTLKREIRSSRVAKGNERRKAALEELSRLKREGGKRSDLYQYKEADPVYEEVDEEKYNEIVQKRREKGRFVVDGDEYDDLGDDTWAFQDDDTGSREQNETKKKKTKKTIDPEQLSAIRKRKLKEIASSVPSQRISDMFLTPTPKVQKQGSENGSPLEGPPSKRQKAPTSKGNSNDLEELINELRADPLAQKASTSSSSLSLFTSSVPSMTIQTQTQTISIPSTSEQMQLETPIASQNKENAKSTVSENQHTFIQTTTISKTAASNSSISSNTTFSSTSTTNTTTSIVSRSTNPISSSSTTSTTNNTLSTPLSSSEKKTSTNPSTMFPYLNDDEEDTSKYTGPNWWTVNKELVPNGTSSSHSQTPDSSINERTQRSPTTQTLFNRPPPLNEDRNLVMYWIDAADDPKTSPGTVYLFGKVWDKNEKNWASCCVAVHRIERTLFIAPRKHPLDDKGDPILDKEVNLDMVEEEFGKVIRRHGKIQWGCRPTKKKYAFEIDEVPKGESEFLEVVYDYSDPELTKADLSGKTYSHIFGAYTSALENFIIQKRLMGPCWLLIENPQHISEIPLRTQANTKIKPVRTWCRYSCFVDKPDKVFIYENYKRQKEKENIQTQEQEDRNSQKSQTAKGQTPNKWQKKEEEERVKRIPPLNICSIKVQTILNSEARQHEVVVISYLMKYNVPVDGPTSIDEAKQHLYEFTFLRKLSTAFPHDFAQHLKNIGKDKKIFPQRNEDDLLRAAMEKLGELDPDIIVGHSFSRFDIDVLLHRMQKFDTSTWSKLGRLHHTKMPSFKKGLTKGTETPWTRRKVTAGRLICDTYFAAKEMIRSKDYELSTLARSQLNTVRYELSPTTIVNMYLNSAHLVEMCNVILNDAFLALLLMFKLNVLPLSLQLTQISGNLWYRSLTGARAERIEFRLLHEFYSYNYILPDKVKDSKEPSLKKKKNPAYEGGLVLEPKKGFYDKMVLLLDFNSLYPSIIQEYNICFTTVVRQRDPTDPKKWLPAEPPPKGTPIGILPTVIQGLVERRRNVKEALKKIDPQKDEIKKQQLEIEQQALKLVANSMYGCLGYPNSRFYAMPLAELITRKGRENLQKTVDIATKMGLEVIYGDTDSIMINTKTKDLKEVKLLGKQLKDKVNQSNIGRNNQKSKLEIEIDGIFETLLLLKKKKYAAKRIIERPDGSIIRMIDKKGLDLVRRDWCDLSKEMGDYILGVILRGDKTREEVIETIHEYLRNKAEAIRAGTIPLEKFVITKSLTKPPEAYTDAKNQPHVQVALAMKRKNKPVQVGEMIRYVICKLPSSTTSSEQNTNNNSTNEENSNTSLAARAFHPDDVKEQNLQIDIEWYMETQILPPILRLVEPIEGTNSALIAHCLGLDPSKHRASTQSNTVSSEAHLPLSFIAKNQNQFPDCEKFVVICPDCKKSQEMSGIWYTNKDKSSSTALEIFNGLDCQNCKKEFTFAFLANSLTLFMRKCILRYYRAEMICDDPTCGQRTRQLCWKGQRPVCLTKGCKGTLHLEYDAKKLYTQLLYLYNMWDVDKILKEADPVTKIQIERNEKTELMLRLREHVHKTLSQNAFGQIGLETLFSVFRLS